MRTPATRYRSPLNWKAAKGLSSTVLPVSSTGAVMSPCSASNQIAPTPWSQPGSPWPVRTRVLPVIRSGPVIGTEPKRCPTPMPPPRGTPVRLGPAADAERIRSSERRRPNWTAAMVAAIVVVIAVIGVNLMSGKSNDSSAQAAPAASASPSGGIGPVLKPSPTATAAAPSSAIAAAPAGKVTVKLSAETAASWLSVKDSKGKTLFQGDLAKGESQTYTDDKKLRIILGNAGGVHLWVNGKDLGTAGADGQVTRLTYTPGNPQAG